MNHYFRKTAAFALTGAMLASSIPLLSFAEEDIPEVDDLPAIVEPGETTPSTDADLSKNINDTESSKNTDSKNDNSSKNDNDAQKSGITDKSKKYMNEYTELFTNARTDLDLAEIYSMARGFAEDSNQKYMVEFTTRTSQ